MGLNAEAVLYGSIWLSLAAWTAGECVRLARRRSADRDRTARGLWTLGFATALLHVALAFHLRHGWSHSAALAETARQTDELLGYRFGGGVYVNYAFLVVWAADVWWWWWRPASFSARRPRSRSRRSAVPVLHLRERRDRVRARRRAGLWSARAARAGRRVVRWSDRREGVDRESWVTRWRGPGSPAGPSTTAG